MFTGLTLPVTFCCEGKSGQELKELETGPLALSHGIPPAKELIAREVQQEPRSHKRPKPT